MCRRFDGDQIINNHLNIYFIGLSRDNKSFISFLGKFGVIDAISTVIYDELRKMLGVYNGGCYTEIGVIATLCRE